MLAKAGSFTSSIFCLFDGIFLLLRRRPLNRLKAVERLGKVILQPLPLEPPLSLIGLVQERDAAAQFVQLGRSRFGQFSRVVLNVMPGELRKKRNADIRFEVEKLTILSGTRGCLVECQSGGSFVAWTKLE